MRHFFAGIVFTLVLVVIYSVHLRVQEIERFLDRVTAAASGTPLQ